MTIYVVIGCYYCSLCLECGLAGCLLEGDPLHTRRLKSRRKSRYYAHRRLLLASIVDLIGLRLMRQGSVFKITL